MERDPLLLVLWIAALEHGTRAVALDRDLAALILKMIARKRSPILA